jgi:deoxyribose-phosphate aldolase
MEIKDILKYVDHTLLKQEATWEQMKVICDDAIKFSTASVCVPPSFVKECKAYCGDKMKICTVIGFPNGYNTTATKVFETEDALKNGADEIDMVINITRMKNCEYDYILNEIKAIRAACEGKILKVIFETCLLTDEEVVKACELSVEAGADFVKTSTGFSTGGATVHHVKLMRDTVKDKAGVKASGGVRTHEDLLAMVEAGANRIGTSAGCKIV